MEEDLEGDGNKEVDEKTKGHPGYLLVFPTTNETAASSTTTDSRPSSDAHHTNGTKHTPPPRLASRPTYVPRPGRGALLVVVSFMAGPNNISRQPAPAEGPHHRLSPAPPSPPCPPPPPPRRRHLWLLHPSFVFSSHSIPSLHAMHTLGYIHTGAAGYHTARLAASGVATQASVLPVMPSSWPLTGYLDRHRQTGLGAVLAVSPHSPPLLENPRSWKLLLPALTSWQVQSYPRVR